jgi:hypothetical protein
MLPDLLNNMVHLLMKAGIGKSEGRLLTTELSSFGVFDFVYESLLIKRCSNKRTPFIFIIGLFLI